MGGTNKWQPSDCAHPAHYLNMDDEGTMEWTGTQVPRGADLLQVLLLLMPVMDH